MCRWRAALRGLNESGAQMFDRNDMNNVAQVFGPVSDSPLAEALDLERTPNVVGLHAVPAQERIVRQLGEYAEKPFSLSFRGDREDLQDRVIHGICRAGSPSLG